MKRACVILANGFEEVEAITPIDYLRRASIEVVVAGLVERDVVGAHGLLVTADTPLEDIDDTEFDCLVIPGGAGAGIIAKDPVAMAMIDKANKTGKLVAAICAAPALVLGEACAMLKGKNFTCYPGMASKVKGGNHVDQDTVLDGNILTSKGPGTAGAFALAIVKTLLGEAAATDLAKKVLL